MLRSANITNFKGFKSVHIEGFKRINVVLGRNASGKTAFMEALFIALGNSPELALRSKVARSVPMNMAALMDPDNDREIWRDFFYKFDLNSKVTITTSGDARHARKFAMRYDEKKGFAPVNIQGQNLLASPMIFSYSKGRSKQAREVRAVPIGPQYHYHNVDPSPVDTAFFAAGQPFNMQETVDRFSQLSNIHKAAPVIEAVSKQFPFIRNIEVGAKSTLYLDIPEFPRKIPIGDVSAGIQKLLVLLIGISYLPGGVVLIDELENGFFYDRYEDVWTALYTFAVNNDVQLIISTHSDEFLGALRKASKSFIKEVSFFRMSAGGSEPCNVEQVSGAELFAVRDIGEIRKPS